MAIFQRIGSLFQTPSQFPDNAMARGKHASLPGGKLRSGPSTGALVVDGRTSVSKISKGDIGAPCDFKHVAHVPWESRFATYIVNPDLKILFSRAGVREEHLKDRRTTKRIFEILERKGGMEAVRQEALSLALSDESRSSHSPSETSSADHSRDPRSAQMLPHLPFNHRPSMNFRPPPPSLPSFDNSEVASNPIPPPPPQALGWHPSNSARSSTAPPCSNCNAVDSVHIPPPPPLPTSFNCVADGSVSVMPPPPPPPPLPFVKNQAFDFLAPSHPPSFDICPPVEHPSLLPLPSTDRNASTIDKCCNEVLNVGIKLSPPSSPPCIRETASEKQMEQPGLLEQIRRGIPLKAVHVDIQVTGVTDSRSRPPSENEGIVSALMDVIQKRHLAFKMSCDEFEDQEGWDD